MRELSLGLSSVEGNACILSGPAFIVVEKGSSRTKLANSSISSMPMSSATYANANKRLNGHLCQNQKRSKTAASTSVFE
jgi:hypothetical protein